MKEKIGKCHDCTAPQTEVNMLSRHILELQADKGRLTDELTEKDKQIENAKEVFADNERLLFENADLKKQIEELKKELEHRHEVELALHEMNKKRLDLEAQIEKMKVCCNCDWSNYLPNGNCLDCDGKKNWKLKEIKEK